MEKCKIIAKKKVNERQKWKSGKRTKGRMRQTVNKRENVNNGKKVGEKRERR